MFGLLIGEFLVPIGTRGIVCIETLLVTVGGGVGLAILSPPLALPFKVSDMLSISSSSCTVSGVLLSKAVASLCRLAYPGRCLG